MESLIKSMEIEHVGLLAKYEDKMFKYFPSDTEDLCGSRKMLLRDFRAIKICLKFLNATAVSPVMWMLSLSQMQFLQL